MATTPTRVAKQPKNGVREIGVCGVEKAIERLAVPQHADVHRSAELSGDPNQESKSHLIGMTTFDAGDRGARHADQSGKTGLGEPPTEPQP